MSVGLLEKRSAVLWKARLVQWLVAGMLSSSAMAGSSLNVIISVVPASGACGTSTNNASVSVSCGFTGREMIQSGWPSAWSPQGRLSQAGMVPALAGTASLPVYTSGVEVRSWRLVSTDNAEYVELTIFW